MASNASLDRAARVEAVDRDRQAMREGDFIVDLRARYGIEAQVEAMLDLYRRLPGARQGRDVAA